VGLEVGKRGRVKAVEKEGLGLMGNGGKGRRVKARNKGLGLEVGRRGNGGKGRIVSGGGKGGGLRVRNG
jgi:hypothetical protein